MKKVLVAMSGGVDSSTSAALLKEQGFEVVGIYMRLWTPFRSLSFAGQRSAQKVAKHLGIPLHIIDLSKEFKKEIVDYFVSEYLAGRTPNPCVICNKKIKFGLLLQEAKRLECDFLATGHYSRIKRQIPNSKFQMSNKFQIPNSKLLKGMDETKDQSYFLWQLSQKQLSKILFPLGNYKKDQTRKLAKKFGLHTAERRESQEICFVSTNYYEFLERIITNKIRKGLIVDTKGNVLGEHKGLPFYTIGQRQGLGIKADNPAYNPWYVVRLDVKNNKVIIGREEDLYQKEVNLKNINWISGRMPEKEVRCQVKIRYGMPAQRAVIRKQLTDNRYQIVFDKPQRAVTPGQSAVFYSNSELLGGGIIT